MPTVTDFAAEQDRRRAEEERRRRIAAADQSGQVYTTTPYRPGDADPGAGTPGGGTPPAGSVIRDHNADGTTNSYIAGGSQDPSAGQLPANMTVPSNYDGRMDMLTGLMGASQQRVAPTATAVAPVVAGTSTAPTLPTTSTASAPAPVNATSVTARMLGPAASAGNVSIKGATAVASQLGAAERANAATIDPLERAAAAQLGPAAQAQDSAFRAGQEETAGFLTRLMRGEESVAALQGKRLQERSLANSLAMGRSGRPGQGATSMRTAAQLGARTSAEIAGRTQEAMLAERMGATSALSGLLGTARGQDLGLSQFNAGETNTSDRLRAGFEQQTNLQNSAEANRRAATAAGFVQGANLQNASESNRQQQVGAELGTRASIASAQNSTAASVAQGQANAQVGIANMSEANRMRGLEAELGTRVDLANSDLSARTGMFNADLESRTGMFNAGEENKLGMFGADLASRTDMFNTGEGNRVGMFNAGQEQQNNQFNIGAGLQQQGLNDSMLQGLLGQQLGTMSLQQQGQVANATMAHQLMMQGRDIEARRILTQMGIDAAKASEPGFWEDLGNMILGAGMAALPALV